MVGVERMSERTNLVSSQAMIDGRLLVDWAGDADRRRHMQREPAVGGRILTGVRVGREGYGDRPADWSRLGMLRSAVDRLATGI